MCSHPLMLPAGISVTVARTGTNAEGTKKVNPANREDKMTKADYAVLASQVVFEVTFLSAIWMTYFG